MKPDLHYTPAKLHIPKDENGDWYVYYSFRNPSTGLLEQKKKRLGINRYKTKAEKRRYGKLVVEEMNQLLREDYSPFGETPEQLPLRAQLEALYQLKKNSNLKRRTWQSYKYSLDIFYKFLDKKKLNHIFPQQFTRQLCHEFIDGLHLRGKSFNHCKNNIGMFFIMMVDKEIIDKNPFAKIKNQKETGGTHVAFSEDEKEKIMNHLMVSNYRLYLFCQFIYYLYIRPIELLRLKVENIHPEQRTVTIYRSQSKNRVADNVTIPRAFENLIKGMNLEQYPKDWYVFGYQLMPSARSYSRNSVSALFKKVKDDLKIPNEQTMYGFKHTGNVAAKNNGIDIYDAMRQNRHSSPAQTKQYWRSLGLTYSDEFYRKMK